jgi:tetratricopeptide (TPR) repeat protein
MNHLARAEAMARRVLVSEPSDAAAAIISSVYRKRGRPREALDFSAKFLPSNNPALLTSRAAAMLDVGEPEEALKLVSRAYAIAKNIGASLDEVSRVYRRLKKEHGLGP